ncbi:MAG: DNA primase [Gammaproteobacteria bacterium]|nr:DNA primase [Gammaproteobacteria bacterium]
MAGKIPQHFIDEVLGRVDIVDVINHRVTLKKRGNNYVACCPFHNEKTPSFSVSQPKQFYHCFGCGESGNAIGFLMNFDNMHFVDAIETLAESVGLEVPKTVESAGPQYDSKPLYQLMEAVAEYYQQLLKETPLAIEYLKARGLSGETAKRFGIGFAPDGWDGLQQAFPGRDSELLKTGMLTKGDAGRVYQRFRNRIMFPIRDRRGRVIAFGGRVIQDEEPKYLNSPETPLFHKGSELYGMHESRKAAMDASSAIVVEGYMDVVALAQYGIENAFATLGTAANQQHSDMLFRVVPNIVFCFDGDRAGRAAAWRALTATLPCLQDGREAHFLFLPEGADPDSVVSSEGAAGFQDVLSTRVSIVDYLYEHLAEELDMSSVGGKAQLAEKAKPLLEQIPRGVYKQLATQRLESLIGLSLGSKQVGAVSSQRSANVTNQAGLTAMSRAVLLLLQHPGVVSSLSPEDFDFETDLRGADVLYKLIGYCDGDDQITTARLLERFRETSRHDYLVKLATKSYWPDNRELDFETAKTEFAHTIASLRDRAKKTAAESVDQSQRTGLLGVRRST